ncbi:MAG: YicC/YloC family endoribonuclease [Gemmatimonadota bacterium]|nr:YicC/YloC family endoribonuclease [Gemmatimonadota bacterium]
MTGFGEAERNTDAGKVRVEIKTVNHRFFNASVRTPNGFDRFESEIQQCLRAYVSRGHITYTLSFERKGVSNDTSVPELDLERARCYGEMLEELKQELGLEDPIGVSDIAGFRDIFTVSERLDMAAEIDADLIGELTQMAVANAVDLRETEGARLQLDLEERLDVIDAGLSLVEVRAPHRVATKRDRLRSAVQELVETEAIDEDRLAREIAYLAEKWDINEEIVRFRSHVTLFRETLAINPPEPVGKRLGFVIQEMQREANTIGSKANDTEISQAVVSLKEEIERLREQLENVE